ncbi:MAG: aminotransferase class I/II-fold pyridoxal phosphate-dependent enzyme [Thermoplasmatota archaeon]
MFEPSERSKGVSYAIREVVLPARKLEAQGIQILKLNIGDPIAYDFDTPQHIKDALYEGAREGHNGYAPSEGYPELREGIARREKQRNGMDYAVDDICVTTGVTESLQIFLSATLNAGDELLVPGPTYPPYNLMTYFNGAEPVAYRTIEEENWQPDVDDVRAKITERTKAMVLVNPNNPTGAVYPRSTVQTMVDIATEHDIPVISDEIYDDIVFDRPHHATASLAKDAPIITFNGFSKVYLVPGWRMGYAIFNNPHGQLDKIKDAFMRIARARLCANSVCQRAMIAALDGPQDHIPDMVRRLKERSYYAYRRLNEIPGLSATRPDGAFYIFPKIEAMDGWKSDKDFVLDVLHEAHVLLVHGSGFSPEYGQGHFRAVTLPSMDMLEEAFNRMDSFMGKRLP